MVRLSRRNVTALAGTFLASTAIRDKAQAQTGSPNQTESSRFRVGVNLHLDRFPPSAAFFQLAHLKAAGVQSVRGLDAALAHVLPGPGSGSSRNRIGTWNSWRPSGSLRTGR